MSLNRYGYVTQNPVNLVDPSGMTHESPGSFVKCSSIGNEDNADCPSLCPPGSELVPLRNCVGQLPVITLPDNTTLSPSGPPSIFSWGMGEERRNYFNAYFDENREYPVCCRDSEGRDLLRQTLVPEHCGQSFSYIDQWREPETLNDFATRCTRFMSETCNFDWDRINIVDVLSAGLSLADLVVPTDYEPFGIAGCLLAVADASEVDEQERNASILFSCNGLLIPGSIPIASEVEDFANFGYIIGKGCGYWADITDMFAILECANPHQG
jgi:hypothetical protein